jgi:hypothetical protein
MINTQVRLPSVYGIFLPRPKNSTKSDPNYYLAGGMMTCFFVVTGYI